jgi:hypothetical protein
MQRKLLRQQAVQAWAANLSTDKTSLTLSRKVWDNCNLSLVCSKW